jgi:DNA-binding FadR family transcriptional regulator
MAVARLANPVRRSPLHEQVARTLSLRIIRREIEPGTVLPNEDALCRQFDVSRTVIREAIRVIATKGLVQVRPRIGTRVCNPAQWELSDSVLLKWRMESEPDIKLVQDLAELRNMIEPMAAGLAAERASESDIAVMTEAYADMEAATTIDEHIGADIRFHLSVIEASGNDLVVSTLRPVIENMLGSSFRRFIRSLEKTKQSLPVHKAVLRAITDGDSRGAILAMHKVIGRGAEDIEKEWPAFREMASSTRRRFD